MCIRDSPYSLWGWDQEAVREWRYSDLRWWEQQQWIKLTTSWSGSNAHSDKRLSDEKFLRMRDDLHRQVHDRFGESLLATIQLHESDSLTGEQMRENEKWSAINENIQQFNTFKSSVNRSMGIRVWRPRPAAAAAAITAWQAVCAEASVTDATDDSTTFGAESLYQENDFQILMYAFLELSFIAKIIILMMIFAWVNVYILQKQRPWPEIIDTMTSESMHWVAVNFTDQLPAHHWLHRLLTRLGINYFWNHRWPPVQTNRRVTPDWELYHEGYEQAQADILTQLNNPEMPASPCTQDILSRCLLYTSPSPRDRG